MLVNEMLQQHEKRKEMASETFTNKTKQKFKTAGSNQKPKSKTCNIL